MTFFAKWYVNVAIVVVFVGVCYVISPVPSRVFDLCVLGLEDLLMTKSLQYPPSFYWISNERTWNVSRDLMISIANASTPAICLRVAHVQIHVVEAVFDARFGECACAEALCIYDVVIAAPINVLRRVYQMCALVTSDDNVHGLFHTLADDIWYHLGWDGSSVRNEICRVPAHVVMLCCRIASFLLK